MLRDLAPGLAFVLLAACGAVEDPTPAEYVGVDQADLSAAELPADVDQAGALPLADDELDTAESSRFVADATLAADGDVAALLPAALATDARSRREVVVAVRWGYFPPRPAEAWTDWSGFVGISRGQIEVIRPLRFENDGDGDLRPNEDFVRRGAEGRVVRFRSHTRPAWDGLLLRVRRPTLGPSVFVIHTGAVTRALAFEELLDLDASEVVDDAGHELRLRARALPAADPCIDEVALAHGEWNAGAVTGTVDAPSGPVAMLGRTLDVRGPYGLVGVELSDPATGAVVGGARGLFAAFQYSPGGILVARVRDGEDDLRGVIVGRFDDAGSFDARVLRRCPR